MNYLNRVYSLEFGRPLKKSLAFPFVEGTFESDRGISLVLTEHRIFFSTIKTASTSINKTEIKIYNISPQSYGFLNASRGEEIYVKLDAGYESIGLKTIVRGTISDIKDVFEGDTRVTTIGVKDGFTNSKEAYTNTAFLPETPYIHIYDILNRDLGLPNGIVIKPKGIAKAPWSFQGPTKEAFKKLAEETDSTFSIQDQSIHFIPLKSQDLITVQRFTPETGLIGSPTALDNTSDILQGSSDLPKVGIKFKVLLDGALIPNRLVKIESREYDGVFKIQKVTHTGDFRGNPWFTECEASQLSPFLEGEV